ALPGAGAPRRGRGARRLASPPPRHRLGGGRPRRHRHGVGALRGPARAARRHRASPHRTASPAPERLLRGLVLRPGRRAAAPPAVALRRASDRSGGDRWHREPGRPPGRRLGGGVPATADRLRRELRPHHARRRRRPHRLPPLAIDEATAIFLSPPTARAGLAVPATTNATAIVLSPPTPRAG